MQVSPNGLKKERFDPRDLGIDYAPISAITGGDARHNANVTLGILRGEKSPASDAVLLNAAATVAAYNGNFDASVNEQFQAGFEAASEAIDSGKALDLLERWIELTQSMKI